MRAIEIEEAGELGPALWAVTIREEGRDPVTVRVDPDAPRLHHLSPEVEAEVRRRLAEWTPPPE